MIQDTSGRQFASAREWWAEVERHAGCKGCDGSRRRRPEPKPEPVNTWSDEPAPTEQK